MSDREAFEKWYLTQEGASKISLILSSTGQYLEKTTQLMYFAWLAATETQQGNIDALEASLDTAWDQAQKAKYDLNHYGLHLEAALDGQKLLKEPEYQLFDAVRALVAKLKIAEEALITIAGSSEQHTKGLPLIAKCCLELIQEPRQ